MKPVIAVIGEGVLADIVARELEQELGSACRVVRLGQPNEAGLGEAALALVLHDAWQPSIHAQAEQTFQASGIPWLRAFATFGEAVIGPLVRAGVQGCSVCADLRFLMAGSNRPEMHMLHERLAEHGGKPRDPWASVAGLRQTAQLLLEEVQRLLSGQPSRLEGRMLLVDLKSLRTSRHAFLPNPLCPVCSSLPEDSASAARIELKASPKLSPDSFRTRSMEELKPVLARDYLDFRTGFLNGKMTDLTSPFADVSVNLPLMIGDEGTAGRTHTYTDSLQTAILEGLERYCGLSPRGKRSAVHDSYSRLADYALNPLAAGVHAREHYAMTNFPYKPFDPDASLDWVWGYSLVQERSILVPELLAYYSLGFGSGYVYETSNGCALGGSLVEAIFHGIMEVVERDSFLMTWYAQLRLPRLDCRSADDQELQLLIDRMETVTGFDLHVFNSTMEHGIPSLWAIAKNRKPRGMNLICAAGAHLDPVKALKSAIYELAGMALSMDEKFESSKDVSLRMLRDPYLVQSMEHHSMLYGLPQAEERLHFLLENRSRTQTFGEAFKPHPRHTDLTEDLQGIVASFQRLGLDIIVVNQTTPELQRNGLHCVKVLIPGMLPMTFGHHLTRLTGLERVLRVPQQLGYTKKPLTLKQLNPHPHPFP
ncbi:TOMM precursor leader peptide-binding protein [Paenibacillus cremeus]|uniref:TOMM leader peptide-binding protein n=1 Tax=Paenibacillus cremeus TaxID=2163881 RepID=A0A559K6L1_9BACL|nr:TOMM precursor leader peptide-binding protein [Paenibacillus cremeus]TVY07754.1 TOMM precursor leader peptide-binding protein [Paenibacillus cremeus]